MKIDIEYVDKLTPIFTRPKRVKIIVGGRGSTKSTAAADYVLAMMMQGKLWCCAREYQNSIEESVHRSMLDEVDRLSLPGFKSNKSDISHISGGRNFYRGLARNVSSLKSMLSGIDGLWIEEGEDISEQTLRVLTASVRLNAKDTQRAMSGENVKMPEIIVTMNRGSREDAISKKWLSRADSELEKNGFYEDDLLMVSQVNYTDMPKNWFLLSGLEEERADDFIKMDRAEYDHKWLAKYLETVDNAIIKPEWFDACVDAHLKLKIKPRGKKVVSYDPSDDGPDDKGICYRHGSIVYGIESVSVGDIAEGTDYAIDYAKLKDADSFVWDGDGMGIGLRKQIGTAFEDTNTELIMYRGSEGVDNPDAVYQSDRGLSAPGRTNSQVFKNKRAQYCLMLADRIYNTYRAVVHGDYKDPETLISFSSDIEYLSKFKSECCRIPRIPNGNGLIQIMSKDKMAKPPFKIKSPNMFDAAKMSLKITPSKSKTVYIPPAIRPMRKSYGF